jgi:hypothetical protein
MPAKFAAICAGLFALTQAVLLALFLFTDDDQSRSTLRAVDAACLAAFAGLAAVTLLIRPLRIAVVPTSPDRGLWRVIGVAAALLCAGQGLRLTGLLMAGSGPLNSWQVAGHIGQGVGMGLIGGSVAVALWQTARRRSASPGG